MGKLVVTEFLSLDGVFEAPGPDGSSFKYRGWTFDYANEEFMQFKLAELQSADAQLLGRITYEGFAKAWPQRNGDEFSDKFNSMPKYVISKTLKEASWSNSHLVSKNIVEEIKNLKEQYRGDILVAGSGELVRFLTEEGLVDQYNFLIYPVVLGVGKKLFQGLKKRAKFKLIEERPFKTGVVLFKYQLAK